AISCGVVACCPVQRPRELSSRVCFSKLESWWTGKDSNLRSPQGAADLQSAGFSHSPTRPGKLAPGYRIRIRETLALEGSKPALESSCFVRERVASENTKRTRVQRHQPSHVTMTGFAPPSLPC